LESLDFIKRKLGEKVPIIIWYHPAVDILAFESRYRNFTTFNVRKDNPTLSSFLLKDVGVGIQEITEYPVL